MPPRRRAHRGSSSSPGQPRAPGDDIKPGPTTELHSRGTFCLSLGARRLRRPATGSVGWADTRSGLLAPVGGSSALAVDLWRIEEIDIGMRISIEVELLFIATPGATGSIQLKLTRRDSRHSRPRRCRRERRHGGAMTFPRASVGVCRDGRAPASPRLGQSWRPAARASRL